MARKATRSQPTPFFPEPDAAPLRALAPLPASARPLFLPDLVRKAAEGDIGADGRGRALAHERFLKWLEDLKAGVLSAQTETQLEQDFSKGLLAALGYQTSSDVTTGQAWSMQIKWSVPGVGIADAALGRFWIDDTDKLAGAPAVIVELKTAGTDLDRRAGKRSPVEQAFDYLNASDEATRWAIVSNYSEFRLYSRQRGSRHVHRVALADLEDRDAFSQFYAVFQRDRLLDTGAPSALTADHLLRETGERQEKVSDELYQTYADRRAELIRELQARGVADLDLAIQTAQRLLDRILFIAFAEDRLLLPDRRTLDQTAALKVPGLSRWRAFQLLFRAIDQGDPLNGVPRYNGSLFKPDPILDDPGFTLDDAKWPEVFKGIGGYDFQYEVTVDVLGRIFERSITDIEDIRARSLDQHEAELDKRRRRLGQRKTQGIYYTDAAIVEYLVGAALNPAWDEQRARLAEQLGLGADVPDPPPADFTRAMLHWLDALTVCDPACGSGAFLNAAYDWFESARVGLLKDLRDAQPDAPECAGDEDRWRADSAVLILRNNLHGVDLSAESVEIAQLSLWVRTARRGQPLADLSANVLCGNSVVDDPSVDPRAFDWKARFPRVFERGGFDAVVGNPPYVRQERLAAIKPYLETAYRTYHGMADLYVYFYERALHLLRPGGRLAFVVTNKWMKAGYGEPLRRFFGDESWVESVVDFGHAKQFFKDADVFPCFLVARKPTDGPKPETVRVCIISRDLVRMDELKAQVAEHGVAVERNRLGADAWSLEPRAVADLIAKVRERGVPLTEFVRTKPYRGILTGFNEAFLIDTPTKDAIIKADPRSNEIIRPYLRGQDIKRWCPDWAGLWMIALKSSGDHTWPWSDSSEQAELVFQQTFPSIYTHLKRFEAALVDRQDKGRHWWELRSCAYWPEFESKKLMYQEIQYHPSFCLDHSGRLGNNKTFFVATSDLYLLCVLNSPLMWWNNWRYLPHMKDEALSPVAFLMESLPIARPSDALRGDINATAHRLIEITEHHQSTRRDLLDWLKVEYEIAEPSTRLQAATELTTDAFVAEVQKVRGKQKPLTSAALRALREEYVRSVEPARERAAEAQGLEEAVSELVNAAYGLTPEEVRLIWDTAPPRMPIPRPASTV